MKPKKLYKTTTVIWTEYDPGEVDLEMVRTLAAEKDAFCSSVTREEITDSTQFPQTDFFDPPLNYE